MQDKEIQNWFTTSPLSPYTGACYIREFKIFDDSSFTKLTILTKQADLTFNTTGMVLRNSAPIEWKTVYVAGVSLGGQMGGRMVRYYVCGLESPFIREGTPETIAYRLRIKSGPRKIKKSELLKFFNTDKI